MTEVVLFHHVQGRTDGVVALADALAAGRHTVHAPDLFDGERPESIEDGLALVRSIGDKQLDARVERSLQGLGDRVVYAGISLGAGIAQRLAQTRPEAAAALLYEGCLPIRGEWAIGPWPEDVSVQVHGMDGDPFFALEGDLDAARELVASVGTDRAALFVYPGDHHLFLDRSLPTFDAGATELVVQRSVALLDALR